MLKAYCADIPFLKATAQEARLIELGFKPGDIYVEGRGEESLANCIKAMRGKPGVLAVVGTVRVLGATGKAMASQIKALRKVGIVVCDWETKKRSDTEGDELLADGLTKALGSRRVKEDAKYARKIGRKGGHAKLESMRAGRMPEEIAGPIWRMTEITMAQRLRLMNPPGYFKVKWSERTARRHLADKS